MLLFDRANWRLHRPWFWFTLLAALGATAWYVVSSRGAAAWPGGSSLVGFTFGILGGAICLFELLLWVRKHYRAWRIGRAQVWMRAHIWFGLLCVPLLVYHSGFRLGGLLSGLLLILVLLVVASGVFGLALQQYLPTQMLEQVPSETIYSQIDYVVNQLAREADRLIAATCGPAPGEENLPLDLQPARTAPTGHLVVGAMRTAGRVQGKVLETVTPMVPVPESEPLRVFGKGVLIPYLKQGAASNSPLQRANQAGVAFSELRVKLDPAAHPTVAALQSLCEQRRQLDVQARLHFWLHSWLLVHLPLSVALIVLMFFHIFVAMKFW